MQKKAKITADLKANRLRIILSGRISKADIQEIYTDIRFCVADLQPGFDLVTDFRQCRIGYLTALGTFNKIREYLQQKGLRTAIRISGKNQLVFHQISKITAKSCNYNIIYVKTEEEAEQALTSAAETSQQAC